MHCVSVCTRFASSWRFGCASISITLCGFVSRKFGCFNQSFLIYLAIQDSRHTKWFCAEYGAQWRPNPRGRVSYSLTLGCQASALGKPAHERAVSTVERAQWEQLLGHNLTPPGDKIRDSYVIDFLLFGS